MSAALKAIDIAADNAAADAAADARAEARAEARKRGSNKSPKSDADGWHRFVVDIWITDLNPTEFGIYKRSRNRAKSRQFTTDMDVYGEIIENGSRTGLIAYREDLWKKKEGMDKRLVFKLFTENLNWRATMDLMIARSVQQTFGARGLPVMTYSINTNDDNYLIYMERSANKWPFLPEHFSFFIIDDKGKPEFYRLERALINLGGDYALIDQYGETIGHLDGWIFSIGGKWKAKIKSNRAEKRLVTVMKLFGGMMVFNKDVRNHMRRLYRGMLSGKIAPDLERQEADLYMNPRRTR